jgi:carboxyl-terminal processing protease
MFKKIFFTLKRAKTPLRIASFMILSLALLLGSFYGGVAYGFHKSGEPADFKKVITSVINRTNNQPKEIDFSLFWDVWSRINQGYAGEVDDQKRVYGAIEGMVAALGDPYSVFLPPALSKDFKDDLSGDFSGIGAEMEMRDNHLTVVAPLAGSPAEKAGIRAKDVVLQIDGVDVNKYGFGEAIQKIRGPEGTQVTLTIFRPPSEKPFNITITRQKIHVSSVTWEEKNGLYIARVRQFSFDTVPLLKSLAAEMARKNADRLILDLRNNPGGFLDVAREAWRLFSDQDPLLYQKEKDGKLKPLGGTGSESPFLKTKLVILVNNGSASASEILAGAVKDYNRGKVVGEKTYGKGSVQELQDLRDGSSLKITTALWLTPNKLEINKVGIEPDYLVELKEEDIKNNKDPQLEKAIEVVKSL